MHDIFKAIGDPTRRNILEYLRKEGRLAAGDIAARFDMTQATVSHHLSILKEAGLINDKREGKYIFYEINTTIFEDVLQWLYEFIKGDAKDE